MPLLKAFYTVEALVKSMRVIYNQSMFITFEDIEGKMTLPAREFTVFKKSVS